MTTTMGQVEGFLGLKRIAVVGVSRDPKELSNTLWQELRQRRYDAIPVNPSATEIDGRPCYASVREIDPGTPVVHRIHGAGKRLTGSYPKAG